METPIRTFRGSYVSLTGWLLVILFFFGAPIVCLPMLFINNEDIAVDVGFGLLSLVIVLTILRYLLLRVDVAPGFIRKRGIFGMQTVALSPETRIRYSIVAVHAPHMHGAGLVVALASPFLSDSQRKNYTLHIETVGVKMRITSSVKDVHLIAEHLQRHEMEVILPGFREVMAAGGTVDSGPIKLNLNSVAVNSRLIPKPLPSEPTLENGRLILYGGTPKPKKIRVRLKNIRNPIATFQLLEDTSTTAGKNP